MKYIIKDTNLFYKGKLYFVGSQISIPVSECKSLENILIPVKVIDEKNTEAVAENTSATITNEQKSNPKKNKNIK